MNLYHSLMKWKCGNAPYIPRDQLDKTLAAQARYRFVNRDRAILMLSHFMGLRAKELAALRIGDAFDPHTGQVKEVVRLLAAMLASIATHRAQVIFLSWLTTLGRS